MLKNPKLFSFAKSCFLMWLVLQVDKLYDEKDEDYDPREKDEEIARMREHVMSEVSENLSGY